RPRAGFTEYDRLGKCPTGESSSSGIAQRRPSPSLRGGAVDDASVRARLAGEAPDDVDEGEHQGHHPGGIADLLQPGVALLTHQPGARDAPERTEEPHNPQLDHQVALGHRSLLSSAVPCRGSLAVARRQFTSSHSEGHGHGPRYTGTIA